MAPLFDPNCLKPCKRCGGCGQYSFNLMHGTMCYGCSGRGWNGDVLTKKDIKPTSLDKDTCVVGDILKTGGVHYRVIRTRWFKGEIGMGQGNQKVIGVRLVDGKQFKIDRTCPILDAELSALNGHDAFRICVPEGLEGQIISEATPEQIEAWKVEDAKYCRVQYP
jgi:hypothetical protein